MADQSEQVRRVREAIAAVAVDTPPAERAHRLEAAMDDAARLEWRRRGQEAVREMTEQLCQELAQHQNSTVEKVWGRLVADQFRDLSSLQPSQEKTAPSVVRQAERAAAVGA
ncbi:hypothetical protein ACFVXC_35900 [Streptomyces sp. NPDC058257]|uniref:hypothetical protein n=1 Tax=Streptomyces sp. NPDC058257 TaxID=3346409 RepID=UPI0036ED1192